MKVLIIITTLILCSFVHANEIEFWKDGKITPEQPFKALVVGVIPGWKGDTVILKESGGEERYCYAHLHMNLFSYEVVSKDDYKKRGSLGATFLSPAVKVDSFSWSMSMHKLGRFFGDEDYVKQWYPESKPH